MSQIKLSAAKIKKALSIMEKDPERKDDALKIRETFKITQNLKNTAVVLLPLKECGENFANALLSPSVKLTPHQRLVVNAVYGAREIPNVLFTQAKELYDALKHLKVAPGTANVAFKIGNRLYPAHATISYITYQQDHHYFQLIINVSIGGLNPTLIQNLRFSHYYYNPAVAELSNWEKDPTSVVEWLAEHNIFPLTQEILDGTAKKLADLEELPEKTQMLCTGPAILIHNNWFGTELSEEHFGTFTSPEKVIVDSEFEFHDNPYGDVHCVAPLTPLIRVFSLRKKLYTLIDIGDLLSYEYDVDAVNRLIVSDKNRNMLTAIFNKKEELFGDVISGKHGGMVIMASGPPGVGKTLTAEIMAEYTNRPLYVMELGELGTNLSLVENNLNLIFKRASRWNALLLFDEADVFLHQRDDDLERSAIVGVFLRLLDYFPGVLFLTTNRVEVIDHAIKSRITLGLKYPELTLESREKIWKVMFSLIGQKIESVGELPKIEINGRQIRNLMRLATTVYGLNVTPEQIYELSEFTPK